MISNVQIRNLPLNEKSELIKYLEEQESWKKLMAIIPQVLSSQDYKCDITINNPAKYKSEDFHTVENASDLTRRFCSDILLREWSTSGRVLPTLGHLKYLLEKAQLFHAADFITVKVLKQERPIRPRQGPAAPITFNSEELEDSETKKIVKILDALDYPSSAIQNIHEMSSIDVNINYPTKEMPKVIPKIIISTPPDVDRSKPSFNVPLVVQNQVKSESDMIKFSTNTVSSDSDNNANVPNLSSLLSNNSSNNNIPAVIESMSGDVSEENRPNLSALLSTSNDNVPSSDESNLSNSSGNFPAISHLLDNSSSSATSNPSSRSCSSPLPDLSLNTVLPHLTYTALQTATRNFDETPADQGGRFLGAGSFGKVYLGELLSKPIAVKKIILDNSEVVQVDDRVSRQFRAEVEILSKYRHENLVTLLGYSCDGLTYCLVYEFVPGGALTEKLQKHELIWTERLYIALGTARAINYLHTACSTPLTHRDVKSANILLDVNNKPKLCDFGLIKRSLNQNTYTATTIQGTSAYMAPEAFRGDVSPKLDTFSFGVVLLELLTSKPPMDQSREGIDLVTHVDDHCPEKIDELLDTSVGSWTANSINFGQEVYEIARECLQEKKQYRPAMNLVCKTLGALIQKSV